MKKLTLLLSSVFLTTNVWAESDNLARHLATIEEPIPIKRINPKYPLNAAKQGRSGWARFSFIIEADGSVSNIVKIDSSGSRDFERESIKAIKQWKYEPAIMDGKLIQRCVNTIQMDFRMGNKADAESGVRRKFSKKYRMAIEALEQQDYAKVEDLIDQMSTMRNRHAAEHNFLQTVKAAYFGQKGDKAKQLEHLSEIRFSYSSRKSKQHQHSVLHQKFALALELNQVKVAFNTYTALMALDVSQEYKQAYKEAIEELASIVESEQDIIVQNYIDDAPFTVHALVRNAFSFHNVTGELDKIEVRCNSRYHVYSVNEQSTWQLPQDWSDCMLYIYGKKDTRFTLVEHVSKASV